MNVTQDVSMDSLQFDGCVVLKRYGKLHKMLLNGISVECEASKAM